MVNTGLTSGVHSLQIKKAPEGAVTAINLLGFYNYIKESAGF